MAVVVGMAEHSSTIPVDAQLARQAPRKRVASRNMGFFGSNFDLAGQERSWRWSPRPTAVLGHDPAAAPRPSFDGVCPIADLLVQGLRRQRRATWGLPGGTLGHRDHGALGITEGRGLLDIVFFDIIFIS